jgi:hypothetical protein
MNKITDTIQIFCWKCGKPLFIPANMIAIHDKLCKDCGSNIDSYFENYKDVNLYTAYKLYIEKGSAQRDSKCSPTQNTQ